MIQFCHQERTFARVRVGATRERGANLNRMRVIVLDLMSSWK